jgi:hypothetical protein
MIVMHSVFDLEASCSSHEFSLAFGKFSEHLVHRDLLVSSRYMQRIAHEGFNADAPSATYYLAMGFNDLQQAQECWNYVLSNTEPIRTLHNKIKTNTRNSSFFLCQDIATFG